LSVRFSAEEIQQLEAVTAFINRKVRTQPDTDCSESIVIICPDTNITLWPTRLAEAATGGGKSAILRLAMAGARAGHPVTIVGAAVVEGEIDGVTIRELSRAAGKYDVAIYVTGLLGPTWDEQAAQWRQVWRSNPPSR
jgi:hypothetical protein